MTVCPKCQGRFIPERKWQKFCSNKCRINFARNRRNSIRRGLPAPKICLQCSHPVPCGPHNKQFCSVTCQTTSYKLQGRPQGASRSSLGLPPSAGEKVPYRRPLLCKWCRGDHPTNKCHDPKGNAPITRQFGTVANGDYVPYPGSRVSVRCIAPAISGETLARILKDEGETS
jgi:hypothetical protein